jgi:hypothetical protein
VDWVSVVVVSSIIPRGSLVHPIRVYKDIRDVLACLLRWQSSWCSLDHVCGSTSGAASHKLLIQTAVWPVPITRSI